MKTILRYTIDIYKKNFFIVLLALLPGLVAFITPLIINAINKANPLYFSLGAIFLRTGRIIDITAGDFFLLIIPLAISLYLLSFAIVSINFIVKMQRTLRKIGTEEIKKITTYTNSLFLIFLAVILIDFIIQLLTFGNELSVYISSLFRILAGVLILFAPSAIVIDEERIINALKKSYRITAQKPILILQILLLVLVFLSLMDYIVFTILEFFGLYLLAPLIIALINCLIVVPFLLIMLTQIYISKYTILV
ncbi:MAG: hypothetical protein N3D10_02395 [Candidatus Micrarchaeota archaeon]|nr:hypothetical protein [Candidatus Micrarchaeota archaeon]